jgi:Cu+-exporting ATPase
LFGAERLLRSGEDKIIFCGCWSEPNVGPLFGLAAADIGIVMSTGTDVAMEAGDITLMKDDLLSIVAALKLSKATMKIIKQNLFWAYAYNTILIPVAAGILYPFFGILLKPILAACAMGLSSLSVVTNSLRLKKIKL